MGSISKNFSYSEFEKTSHADLQEKNMLVDEGYMSNCKALVDNILQPLRDYIGIPLNISSGYRCKELNGRVGGASNSQHLTASAADVYDNVHDSYSLALCVKEKKLDYDQMILYPTFVHLSYNRGGSQRNQLLYDKSYNGKKF